MTFAKLLLRTGILVFSAFCLLLLQLTSSLISTGGTAYANQPFPTVPPVDPEFVSPIDEEIQAPTPIPTLGPGQAFEDESANLPEAVEVHGDDEFGYGKIKGEPGLVLGWFTDEDGTHYVVMDATDDLFLGTLDSGTNTRAEDGFQDYIDQRDQLTKQRFAKHGEGFASGAVMGVLAWGIGLCPATGGAGCVAGIVVAGALALGNAIKTHFDLNNMNKELRALDARVADKFDEAVNLQSP